MSGVSVGSGFVRRKRLVKQSNKPVLLLQVQSNKRALAILKHLGAGNSATIISHFPDVDCTKQNVSYWAKKLVSMGALRVQCRDAYTSYSLTPFGQKVLTGSEGYVGEVFCLEDFPVKFVVLEGERVVVDWEKLGEPRNWVKLGVSVGGVTVVRTSSSVIIHPGPLKGFNPYELLVLSGRVVEWVKRVLEDKFGMVLSDEGVPLHDPITRIYSEEARRDVAEAGTVISEGVGATDNSPPARVPHEEYSSIERAHQRHLLPDSVARLERKVDGLQATMESLGKSVEKLAGVVERILGPEPTAQPQPAKGDLGYVT